jgi:hypothetical protein
MAPEEIKNESMRVLKPKKIEEIDEKVEKDTIELTILEVSRFLLRRSLVAQNRTPNRDEPRGNKRFNTRKNTKIKASTGSNTRRFVGAKSTSIPFCEFSAAHTP